MELREHKTWEHRYLAGICTLQFNRNTTMACYGNRQRPQVSAMAADLARAQARDDELRQTGWHVCDLHHFAAPVSRPGNCGGQWPKYAKVLYHSYWFILYHIVSCCIQSSLVNLNPSPFGTSSDRWKPYWSWGCDVVWRKEKESTGTEVKGGCCHWITSVSVRILLNCWPLTCTSRIFKIYQSMSSSMRCSLFDQLGQRVYSRYLHHLLKVSSCVILLMVSRSHPQPAAKHLRSDALPSVALVDSASWALVGQSVWCWVLTTRSSLPLLLVCSMNDLSSYDLYLAKQPLSIYFTNLQDHMPTYNYLITLSCTCRFAAKPSLFWKIDRLIFTRIRGTCRVFSCNLKRVVCEALQISHDEGVRGLFSDNPRVTVGSWQMPLLLFSHRPHRKTTQNRTKNK